MKLVIILDIFNNKLHQRLETVTNFFILNIIWVFSSLPIITIGPATAAMYGVIREWKLKQDTSVFRLFLQQFKVNFKQSFIIGIIGIMVVIVLYIDMYFILRLPSTVLKLFMIAAFVLIASLSLFITIYIFPMITHYQLKISTAMINSCVLAFRYIGTSLFLLFMLIIIGFILYKIPLSIFVLISVTTHFIFINCYKIFTNVSKQDF